MSRPDLPSFADVEDAARRLARLAVRTPLVRNNALDQACGGPVWIKAETLQLTGSFKFRGAYNRLCRLSDDERSRGVVAFSSGNHAQGVAHAAQILDMPAVIVMPTDAPAIKREATIGYGAEVILYDRFTQSREAMAARLAAERGAVVVPAFDDFFVMAGQGTVGLEAAEQLAALGAAPDVLLCPASGGGLLAGIGLAFEVKCPTTKLYVVEPEGFTDHADSLAAGYPVARAPGPASLCDALMAPRPGELTFAINGPRLAGALSVTDDQVLAAMAFAFRHLKLVIEPGGAVGLAALLSGQMPLDGRTALVIASGGNVDPETFEKSLKFFN
jgi:threonine dehydratase